MENLREKLKDNHTLLDWDFLTDTVLDKKVLKEVQKFHNNTMNVNSAIINNMEVSPNLFRWIETVAFQDILPNSYEEIVQLNIKKRWVTQSAKEFKQDSVISLDDIGQLLYEAFGRSTESGSKNYPSAGALYPIVPLLLVLKDKAIEGIKVPGSFVFNSTDFNLIRTSSWKTEEQIEKTLNLINLDGDCIAPYCIAYAIDYKRAVSKYSHKGYRHALIEIGLMAQRFREVLINNTGLSERCWSGFIDMPLSHACGLNVRLCPIALIQWFGVPEKNTGDSYENN
ncbi:hypothetical protein V1498_12340 [Peribacillus sp. SCS-26]|uniref:hypothetical protein n=1 Tax=Paraperibacillus marinus TaxID=3115295 RepID=UPI003905AA84